MSNQPLGESRVRRFGPFELDLSSGELRKDGARVALQDQPLQVLVALTDRPGELVHRDELRRQLWPADTYVDFEHGLNAAVKRLRDALGDSADVPRFVETLPRRGYRFVAEIVGARVVADTEPQSASPPAWHRARGPRAIVIVLVASAVAALAGAIVVLRLRQPQMPRVGEYRQITRQDVLFPPFPSELPILSDGPRIYFTEFVNGRLFVRQVTAAGGHSVRLPLSISDHHVVDAVSPEGAELLVAAFSEEGPFAGEAPAWVVPLVDGAPRRLGDVVGHAAHWLKDGRIVYVNGSDFFMVSRDGTGRRKLMTVPGRPYWPRVSPDGTRIRFTLWQPWLRPALWEARLDGTGLRPLLSNWSLRSDECCGDWTPDGRYFIFQANKQHRSHIWALAEDSGSAGEDRSPVQLTAGPVQFRRAVPSTDGKSLYAIGWHLRGEVSGIDVRTGAVAPKLPGRLSAEWVDYSRDGRWITFVTYPEAELWRARADLTERLRLTTAPIRVWGPRWSPDGTRIAYVGSAGGEPSVVYLVPREGGEPRKLTVGGDPTWSRDGSALAFHDQAGIHVLDFETGVASKVAGSEGLFSPRWSPDGRHLAALSSAPNRLLVYEFASRRWSELARGTVIGYPNWSSDGESIYFRGGRRMFYEVVQRVGLRDGRLKQVPALDDVRVTWGVDGPWLGLAPDDSLLFLRDLSSHEIYALEWRAP